MLTSPGPFKPPVRPAPFQGDAVLVGPADAEPCPCGSARSSASCHLDPATGRWRLPQFTPLLKDALTGQSVAGCFAAFTGDCRGKLCNEHWLSETLLNAASDGKVVRIAGLPWQSEGQISDLTPNVLGSNILCKRHNQALSPLDAMSGAAYATLDSFFLAHIGISDSPGNGFDLISGEQLERWMLKMLWGASAAFPQMPALRASANQNMLANYLFRDGMLPPGWGLYAHGLDAIQPDPDLALEIRWIIPDGETDVWGGSLTIGGVELYFCLGTGEAGNGAIAVHHPSMIALDNAGSGSRYVLALSWDSDTTELAKAIRTVYGPI